MTSTVLTTSPAFILYKYITDNDIGSMTDPSDALALPLYVSYIPDSIGTKTDLGSLFDVPGVKDGRLMTTGEVIPHHGIDLKIRSRDYVTGWAKAEEIATALDLLKNVIVTISSVTYQFDNISRNSLVNSEGVETKGTRKRYMFSVNFIVTLKRIT